MAWFGIYTSSVGKTRRVLKLCPLPNFAPHFLQGANIHLKNKKMYINKENTTNNEMYDLPKWKLSSEMTIAPRYSIKAVKSSVLSYLVDKKERFESQIVCWIIDSRGHEMQSISSSVP